MKEIVRYAIVDDETGVVYNSFAHKQEAITSVYYKSGRTIVKLVGEIPEPKRMKKMAVFVYTDRVSTFRLCSMLMTEQQAKIWCKDAGFNLVQWPYGDVFEVEE